MEFYRFVLVAVAVCLSMLLSSTTAQENPDNSRQLSPLAKETTTADFIRLVVMRLIFGLASAMGYGEGLSNLLGGVFVPPGADYDDDYDYVPDFF